ncbi:hypothetical protein EJ08DRAFT_608169 [Tothia fuscella]|uniref:Glyoxalase-like domain-containing protein n=1 Tax=Tothia fuscella TaxID=1048955 RepID=A0A9P4NXA9_9PEZI|nr:hypothetical protein EJ08DRAFT_608169 [Tothia fuscella]
MPPSFGNAGLDPATTRLRQIALVVKDLDRAREVLTKVLGTEVVFEDPGVAKWGLKNILIAIGGDIIEVVAPFEPGTTAGRLLEKRGGDGGYMIIMQTLDAAKRRQYILDKGLSKVIWGYDRDGITAAQYHPKGIPGGMMPELDSHPTTPSNPSPLTDPFSPWHACGKDHTAYSALMKKYSDIHLSGVLLRLAPGQTDTEAASRYWQDTFGVGMSRDLLAFTNARMGFVRGVEGRSEGLESITIGVDGVGRLEGIWEKARREGVAREGYVEMCGVKWFFHNAGGRSKL